MEVVNVEEKILAYETFVNEKLKTDLKKILDQRDVIYSEIAEYNQLKVTIEKLQMSGIKENLKTQMDIGCNFYATAVIPKPTMICVKVGYGFFVEFTFAEALEFIEKKISSLNHCVEQCSKDACMIKAKIKVVLEGLRELQNISSNEKSEPIRDILF